MALQTRQITGPIETPEHEVVTRGFLRIQLLYPISDDTTLIAPFKLEYSITDGALPDSCKLATPGSYQFQILDIEEERIWTFQVDVQVDKKFTLFGARARAYAYVTNLFNRKNVINVYSRTGNDADDGFLTDPELSQRIVETNGGEPYQQLYQAINLANRQHYCTTEGGADIYGEPRQFRFGVQHGL